MNFRTLKLFCDVVEHRSFSRAAEENGTSQGNVSHLVQSLEQHLGVRLVDRSTRPLEPTTAGQRYYEGLRPLLGRYAELEDDVRALHDAEARRLVVASIYSVGISHVSAVMDQFREAHPRAEARLECLHPHRVYEHVENGEADLGIVSYPQEDAALAVLPWRDEPMAIICHPAHRFAQQSSLTLAALGKEPFIAFESGLAIRTAIDRALADAGAKPRIVLEFDNVETILRAVECKSGVSILPEPAAASEVAKGVLASVAIEGPPLVRPLAIIHRRERPLPELAKQFLAALTADDPFASQTVGPATPTAEADATPESRYRKAK